MAWIFAGIGVLVVAYAGVCLFYALFQERFIFIRFRTSRGYKYKFAGAFEERFIKADDRTELHALYFKAEAPKGVILYFHGNTGSVRRWGKYAHRFVRLGYDVLVPDPRGYGKSRGVLSEEALHADAGLWYDEVLKTWAEKDIVVFGRSLGSGLATPLAALRSPRMLILETPFANLYDVATNYLPILPYRLLLRYTFRNDKAIKVGTSAYNQNCARCHGLEAISGGIAPDLRKLDNDCVSIKDAKKKDACVKEIDEYYAGSVRRGKVRNGAVYMPPFEGILNQEATWAIKAYLETRREKPL